MAWRYANQLKVNGGPGLPPGYFRKPGEPTERQLARRALEKQMSKLGIPKHYAKEILRQGLRPVALRHLLKRIAELRAQLEQASSRLTEIRTQIQQLLKGEPNVE